MLPTAGAALVDYGQPLERFIQRLTALLEGDYHLGPRAVALLLLQDDHRLLARVRRHEPQAQQIQQALEAARQELGRAPAYNITMSRHQAAAGLLADVLTLEERPRRSFRELLSTFCINPWTGAPLLMLVLYVGLYLFVGKLGAGTLVGFLESTVFDRWLLPPVERFVEAVLPWPTWSSLFVGEYGIITLGVKYAVAIVLPVVGTFFLVFSLLEDSGYLPRLALLVDRVFKRIGLNGRAVVPLVLGFGCDTMATMVTRILETRRERIIATLLLALAIPCAAQLGLFAALLSKTSPTLLLAWAAIIAAQFLLVGSLASRLMPGPRPNFYMEVPPLRLPKLSNVLTKTYSRMHWYFKEVFPLFVLASVLIWAGRLTHLFDLMLAALSPIAQALGFGEHSGRMAEVFLFGFFRRDYSAAHLFDLEATTNLTNNQLLVGAVTLTLFMPCIAQFLIMKKEHGWGIALAIGAFTFTVAFIMGTLLNLVLKATGIQL